MINLEKIQHIYFIGIGGIGMSALARYFSFHGKKVSGYDRTETPLTKQLTSEGITVVYSDDASLAPQDVDLVVYTPAIPATHPQLVFFREHNYEVVKRSDVLGAITASSFNICVAGTHGKTTISTMIAHILRDTGYGCNAFLGGIAVNYDSNFWSSENNVCVVEADEYDRSFLKLSPDVAVISAMDADHLDIYGTESSMQDAFIDFSHRIKQGGKLIAKKGLAREKDLSAPIKLSYSIKDQDADVYGGDVKIEEGCYRFDVKVRDRWIQDVQLNMGGLHNVENATVAIAIATMLNIDEEKVKRAVAGFRGVKRRFEYILKTRDTVYIDDYAHHPEELSALISSAKALYKDYWCTVIFQPHLFTRTRDLKEAFARSLDIADEVLLLPIYPAREQPIEGVSADMIAGLMKNRHTHVLTKSAVANHLQEATKAGENRKRLVITAGAGDIDTMIGQVKNILMNNINAV